MKTFIVCAVSLAAARYYAVLERGSHDAVGGEVLVPVLILMIRYAWKEVRKEWHWMRAAGRCESVTRSGQTARRSDPDTDFRAGSLR